LAALVGIAGYAAGVRNGKQIERRQAERSMASASPHGGMEMGMGESAEAEPPPSMPSMTKDEVKAKLAGVGYDELLSIANQHLDEARAAGEEADTQGSERRFTIAAAAYEQALALKPGDPDVTTDLGIALRGLHDPAGAVARFREAAEADPKHPQSRFNLGLVLLHDLGKPDEAVAAWEDYLKVAPKDDATRPMVEAELRKLKS